MPSIEFAASGHNEFVAVTPPKTGALADCGVVQNIVATGVYTLPAAAAGQVQKLRVGKEGITLNVTPNGTDTVSGNGYTPAASKGVIATNQPAGSLIELVANAAGGWTVSRVLGTWTRQP